MTTPKEVLLRTLEGLKEKEFEQFKQFLNQEKVLEDFKSIPAARLEKADRSNTVDEMVHTHGTLNALKVTQVLLEKMDRNDLVPEVSRAINEGVSDVKLEPNTANTDPDLSEPGTKLRRILSVFTPELQKGFFQVSYRFTFAGPGVFQCAETGVVFEMTQGAELRYSAVQWDERRLEPTGKEAAGPLFKIECSEEDAVHQLHFPHCETEEALSIDGLLSVAHITDDGMSILKPLQITDTHVVVKVAHLSLFGLVWEPSKRRLSPRVKGQVMLFLRPLKRGPRTLDVMLLQKNVPVSEVAAQQGKAENIKISGDCFFTLGRNYSVRCEQEGLKLQPERAWFSSDYGPNFHPTFEIFLMTNPDLVTVVVQDQDGTEVWKRDVHLFL